jgi:hypothetical protein
MNRIDVLGRKYSSEIMAAAGTPKSASDLSDDLEIPIATCYRRVNELVAAGFLTEHEDELADGTTVVRFQRATDAIDIRFDDTVSMHTWPREVQPFPLDRFVPDWVPGRSVTSRLPWLGRGSPTEVSSTGMLTSLQQSEQD